MYINTASPDPTVTGIMSCDAGPVGPRTTTRARTPPAGATRTPRRSWTQSDQELDETKRVDLIHQIGQYLVDDAVMLPLYQFPNIAAWRTDKLGGPIDADAANYRALPTTSTSGSRRAATRSPSVPSSGLTASTRSRSAPTRRGTVWTTAFQVLPSVWDTTADGDYEPTDLVDRRARRRRSAEQASTVHSTGSVVWGRREPAPHPHTGTGGATCFATYVRRLAVDDPHAASSSRSSCSRRSAAGTDPVQSYLRLNPRATPAQDRSSTRRSTASSASIAGAVLPLAAATSSPATGAARSRATGPSGRS